MQIGVDMLPKTIRALARPGTQVLYAHTLYRYEAFDLDFLSALTACGIAYREVCHTESLATHQTMLYAGLAGLPAAIARRRVDVQCVQRSRHAGCCNSNACD